MQFNKVLKDNQFSNEVIEQFLKSGIKTLFPPQADAIKSGVLDGHNLLMSVPTAAGKTLIAELCMLKSILHNDGRCLYIAPLKALASEKYNEFKDKFTPLGLNVGIAIGDHDSPRKNLGRYHILIATAEKIDSILRSKNTSLITGLTVCVLDEIHFINDGSRGPTLEILTARIKQLNLNIQILALSATVQNASEMAEWLGAKLVLSDWRPIPLKEGVYFNECIEFKGHPDKKIVEEAPDDVGMLSLDTLRGKGQVLIFVNSRRSAQAVSRNVCKTVAKVLNDDERKELLKISRKIAGNSNTDSTKICRKLADVVLHGAAFHHAGLKHTQRELIEQNFKKNIIKVISCTPTLAAGVNLPARRAIIRDCKRFESGLGSAYIPTSEYKQCAGRAGRPQYDDYGEAVLIAKSASETATLFEKYICADPEPVISKLSNESALRIHILASVAAGYVHDVKAMFEFIEHTFLFHQKQTTNLLEIISDIFEFLHKEKFIEKSGYRFFATTLGALTSRLYIDPITSITIRDGLEKISRDKPLSNIGALHLICATPDGPSLNVGKKDMEDIDTFCSHIYDELILNPENFPELDDFYGFASTLKATWLLTQWIEEEKEEIICDQFNVGPGDVYRHIEATQWLLHAASAIAELLHKKSLTFPLENLRKRIRYGIKEDLLNLIELKGIGRVRARQLYRHGIKKIADIKNIRLQQLADIRQIGLTLAKDIHKQISQAPVQLHS